MMRNNSLVLPVVFLVVFLLVKGAEAETQKSDELLREDVLHQDITNPEVRSAWLDKFDDAKRQHMQGQEDSAGSGKKGAKKLTAKQRAAMIAKMKVRFQLFLRHENATSFYLHEVSHISLCTGCGNGHTSAHKARVYRIATPLCMGIKSLQIACMGSL
jgi:hypothetical protein